jgi:hypothetical protein
MTNNYLKVKTEKNLEPKKSTIDFLLNYSKSIHCVKTKKLNLLISLN